MEAITCKYFIFLFRLGYTIFYRAFGDMYPRAIDEIWYRRAVDFYYVNRDAYVYSVPFDSGNTSDILVTVSHAIFVEHGAARAPAAVVGFQFQYKALRELFFNKTSTVSFFFHLDGLIDLFFSV